MTAIFMIRSLLNKGSFVFSTEDNNATLQSVITIVTTNIVVKIENERSKIVKK